MKRVLSLVVIVVLVLSLVACNSNQNNVGNGGNSSNSNNNTNSNTNNNNSNNTNNSNNNQNNSSQITLSFKTLDVSGNNVYGKVSNTTETFSFLNEIKNGPNTTYKVCLDMYGFVDVPTKTVSLEVGDNTFYVLENTSNQETLYTVTIRRKPIYTVRFTNSYDHAVCSSQKIEEDGTLAKPNDPTKNGYDFLGWDRSFPIVITSDTTVTSRWKINWEKMLRLSDSTVKGLQYSFVNGDTKEIIIPSFIDGVAVTKIGVAAFSSMEWTEYIEVPDTVTHIEKSAFRGCDRLEKMVLSKNLEYIGDMTFDGCVSLKTIEFNGTIDEWNEIVKGEHWNRNVPATHVICSDGMIEI